MMDYWSKQGGGDFTSRVTLANVNHRDTENEKKKKIPVSGKIPQLSTLLPIFRSPELIQLNKAFLIDSDTKPAVLDMLAHGLRGD